MTRSPDAPPLRKDALALAAAFAASGTLHLVRPQLFEPIIPHGLPAPRMLVHASGIAEIACALGMLVPRTRRMAGLGSAALLVAIFPANVQMSITQGRQAAQRKDAQSLAFFLATLARLPAQWPMIRTALRAAGH